MYRIRLHGRGGQGVKTGGRILGATFFAAGYEVQDAPFYGAERRGAPICAYVRAARQAINERGPIRQPDLVIVADDTLMQVPAAGALLGLEPRTVLLLASFESADEWRRRLNLNSITLTLPAEAVEDRAQLSYSGAVCAGAAARLVGLPRDALTQAMQQELAPAGATVMQRNLDRALEAYERMAAHAGVVSEGGVSSATSWLAPAWVELTAEDPLLSAPTIHAAATSVQVKTGLWRTMRPVIDYHYCRQCLAAPITLEPDHNDILAARDCGFLQIHCAACQEVLDSVLLAYRLAEDARVRLPVIVNLDGFYLSFTREPVTIPPAAAVDAFLPPFDPASIAFRASAPISQATAVLGGAAYSYFRYELHLAAAQALAVYDEIAREFAQTVGGDWPAGSDDAELAFVMLGSFATKDKEAVDRLREAGWKIGLLRPRLLRPFPAERLRRLLAGKQGIAVIDQNLSMGKGGVLHAELASALYGQPGAPPALLSFIGGLGGRDITPEEFYAMAAATRQAVMDDATPPPRLLYRAEELREVRRLQAIATVERQRLGAQP